jgi:hypothetical protein
MRGGALAVLGGIERADPDEVVRDGGGDDADGARAALGEAVRDGVATARDGSLASGAGMVRTVPRLGERPMVVAPGDAMRVPALPGSVGVGGASLRRISGRPRSAVGEATGAAGSMG